MIAISCFSAAATCTLSGARVYMAMAQDGAFFKSMAKVHPKWRTPAFSLIGQGMWAALLTLSGRYDQLYTYVIFGMVLSYTLTVADCLSCVETSRCRASRPVRRISMGASDLCHRRRRMDAKHNYHSPKEAIAGAAIVLIGVPGYLYWKSASRNAKAAE